MGNGIRTSVWLSDRLEDARPAATASYLKKGMDIHFTNFFFPSFRWTGSSWWWPSSSSSPSETIAMTIWWCDILRTCPQRERETKGRTVNLSSTSHQGGQEKEQHTIARLTLPPWRKLLKMLVLFLWLWWCFVAVPFSTGDPPFPSPSSSGIIFRCNV